MDSSYDEDISLNPFYKALTTKGKTLYHHAAEQRWTICIPRKGVTSRSQHNKHQFETHILKPSSQENSNSYFTVNDKEVKINGSFIVTTKGFSDIKSVKILFEETFFNPKEESYHVLCIDQLLDGTGNAFSNHSQPVLQNLETLDSCCDFLWKGTGSRRAKDQIDEILALFNSTYTRLSSESIRHTMDAANAVFTRAMQISLKHSHLKRPAMSNKGFMDNVKIAVETYVMDGIYKQVFKGISSFLGDEDGSFNKTTRNLASIQVKDLGVNPILWKYIPKAKKILSNLNRFTTPLEKLYVLKLTISTMSESSKLKNNQGSEEINPITADDLLPALVFLVVKSEIPNWMANLTYMQNFHFSRCKNDEFQFYLSSTEAAVEHVRSGQLDNLISSSQIQKLEIMNSLFQRVDSADKFAGPTPVDVFFEHIRSNRVDEVLKMLNESVTTMKEITEAMCHPLCSCDTCEKLLASKRKDPTAVTVFSRDNLGCTALHQAAEFGCEEIIYELIKKGGVVNASNYHGSTPLHLACQRGHHKTAVLLIHYGGDANCADNLANAPIHLAVENGHEMCVEFLCSNDEEFESHHHQMNLNITNESGDTPLHIASRWGYGNLVEILIKHDASDAIKNKEGKSPSQCAHNSRIYKLFGVSSDSKEPGYIYLPPSEKDKNPNRPSSPNKDGFIQPDSPNTSKRKREFTRLLKAIAEGDMELVRQKLGINLELDGNNPTEDPDLSPADDMLCHPLCQCDKCSSKQKRVVSESVNLTVNMSTRDGARPLHIAALHGHENIVRLLVKYGKADPDAKSKSSHRTPLHLACQYNNIECVSILLKYGARANIKDSNGNTALHFCCTNGHIGPAILVLQGGGNVHAVNQRGNTPLHDAARWNYVDLVRLLLYYDATVATTNKMGYKPLDYAKEEEIRTLLLEASIGKQVKEIQDVAKKKRLPKVSFPDDQLSDDLLFTSPPQQFDDHSKYCTEPITPDEFANKENKQSTHKTMYKNRTNCQCPKQDNGLNELSKNKLSVSNVEKDTDNCQCPKFEQDVVDSPFFDESLGNKYSSSTRTNAGVKVKSRRTTVADIFSALEQDDVARLKEISRSIKVFDRKKSLRRVSTLDKTNMYLTSQKTLMSIKHFNQSCLQNIAKETRSKSNSSLELHSLNEVAERININEIKGSETDLLDDNISQENILLSSESELDARSENDDWFENDIATDSADEAKEEIPDFIVTELSPPSSVDDSSRNRLERSRIKDLLNEAINDEINTERQVTTPLGVSRTLTEDDDLFVPRLAPI